MVLQKILFEPKAFQMNDVSMSLFWIIELVQWYLLKKDLFPIRRLKVIAVLLFLCLHLILIIWCVLHFLILHDRTECISYCTRTNSNNKVIPVVWGRSRRNKLTYSDESLRRDLHFSLHIRPIQDLGLILLKPCSVGIFFIIKILYSIVYTIL